MKLKLLTDLHMEGNKFHYTWDGEDVLLLGGDIHSRNRHHQLLDQIPPNVKVYMVAGNHEYYHEDFNVVKAYLKALEEDYTNFQFLDNQGVTIGDIELFAGTMFTDFKLYGEIETWFARDAAKRGINDFWQIEIDGRTWTVEDHLEEHNLFVKELVYWKKATEGKRRIVMTHFMPTEEGNNPRFANSLLNPYFTADMSYYMTGIEYWFCGHGHSTRDVDIDGTRVIMNPRGYTFENEYGFRPNYVMEI